MSSSEADQENIAAGLAISSSVLSSTPNSNKSNRKSRSKSIGPGGPAIDVPLKEDTGNRRKSAFVPAVKSILSREDEVKRREARRKSLASRRVSFAPEATLHTWDVIEYIRDATASSSSSNSTQRASSVTSRSPRKNAQSPASNSDTSEPPSTPPEQVEERQTKPSPNKQREKHSKKNRRRSSGIPPMNFNNPDDVFSSSPFHDASPNKRGGHVDEDDGGSTVMGLESGLTAVQTSKSSDSNDSTGSSARLEEALRQAAMHAGTGGIDNDESEEVSMEIAGDEITAAFKPWVQKISGTPRPKAAQNLQDQENVNPFSPAFAAAPKSSGHLSPSKALLDEGEGGGDEMSMDITRSVGGILSKPIEHTESDDATMDLTTAVGGIQPRAPISYAPADRRSSLKRRRSSSTAPVANDHGSPAKKQARKRVSIFPRPVPEEFDVDDGTMDLTLAVGGIQATETPEDDRRVSTDTSFGEEPMDLTMIMGGIQETPPRGPPLQTSEKDQDENEELTMELTGVIGGVYRLATTDPDQQAPPTETPETPSKAVGMPQKPSTPARSTPQPTEPPRPAHGAEKHGIMTPQRSTRKSPRKSMTPNTQQQISATNGASPFLTRLANSPSRKPAQKEAAKPNVKPSPAREKRQWKPPGKVEKATPVKSVTEEMVSISGVKSATDLTTSFKLLSTPSKLETKSPAKRLITPAKKTPTPRKASPAKKVTPMQSSPLKKQVRIHEADTSPAPPEQNGRFPAREDTEEPIRLQDFLNLTNIRFMDLTTTKRRHTAMPSSLDTKIIREEDDVDGEKGSAPSLENCVIAAACTVPMLELFQHSCHELRKYISGGKAVVREIEEATYTDNPPLFREYLSAPPDEKHIMDTQFKNIKTYARLQSKGMWYEWRATLLRDLKQGLSKISRDFDKDEQALEKQEELLASVLPSLVERNLALGVEQQELQERADELADCDQEELEAAREKLASVENDIEERRLLVEALQEELKEKEESIEAVKERKDECAAEIREADRVREEYRGWSAAEVRELKAKVDAIESAHGWIITSSSCEPTTLTLTYNSDLQLFLHPHSFQPSRLSSHALSTSSTPANINRPISLSYIGDDTATTSRPRPLSTTKRFFLQLLRAHLHALPQSRTSLPSLLRTLSRGWHAALAVDEGARRLHLAHPTTEAILDDERMAVDAAVLLTPALRTKVRVRFKVTSSVDVEPSSAGGEDGVRVDVTARAEVVYGQRYKEDTMCQFLESFCGKGLREAREMGIWAEAVADLRERLVARGRKD